MSANMKRAMQQAALFTAGFLSLVGCGGFFPPLTPAPGEDTGGNTGNYVYVANSTTSTIAGFSIATSTAGIASLTALTNSPYSLSAVPTSLAVTPANTFVYVAVIGAIYVYSINTSTGALTIANSGGAAAINSLGIVSMDISPDGQWLVALASDGATINEYQINSTTGALAVATGIQYVTAGNIAASPKMIRFSPNGAFVGAALGTGGDIIIPFTTSTGALSSTYPKLATGDTQTGDNAIIFDKGNTFAYIARTGTTNGVAVYTVTSGGDLSSIAGSPFAAGAGTFALQIDSTGKYIFAANRTDGTISGFTIGTGGVLTAIDGSPYASGSGVTALASDNTTKYLLAIAAGGTPDLTIYSFDATVAGKLVSATTAPAGTDPAGSIAIATTH